MCCCIRVQRLLVRIITVHSSRTKTNLVMYIYIYIYLKRVKYIIFLDLLVMNALRFAKLAFQRFRMFYGNTMWLHLYNCTYNYDHMMVPAGPIYIYMCVCVYSLTRDETNLILRAL